MKPFTEFEAYDLCVAAKHAALTSTAVRVGRPAHAGKEPNATSGPSPDVPGDYESSRMIAATSGVIE